MEEVITGLSDAFTLANLSLILLGIILGQVFGAIPGLSAITAIAIAVPLTYYMSPLGALGFLVGINKGGTVGGAMASILMNTPGSPEAAATAFDGHPLAKQGKALKALKISLYSSISGDTFSDLVLIAVSAPLAMVAIRMGPPEMMAVMIFAMTIVASLVGKSMIKGLIAALIGVLLSTIGLDPEGASDRLTFGVPELLNGLPIAAVAIGLLAMGEVFRQITVSRDLAGNSHLPLSGKSPEDRRISLAEYISCLPTIFRSAVIGTGIGAIPGVGSSAAAFIGYDSAKRADENPESFGKGNIKGVAAVEAANSAVVGANFIPLLSLGIPGNISAALILGAFIIHGVTPGPQMMQEQGRLIYGLFGSMIIANFCNFLVGNAGLRLFALITYVPARVIFPMIGLFCLTGAYLTNGAFAIQLVILFGLIGYFFRMLDFSFITFVIGFVLGPLFELSFRQTVILSGGDFSFLLGRPIALTILILAAISVLRMLRHRKKTSIET